MTEPHDITLAQARISRSAKLRRRGVATLCAFSLMLQQACYTTIPVAGVMPAPQGPVRVTVNDRGRVLVGSRLGSLLDHVDGRIVRSDSVNMEIAVETAVDVRGSLARWGGERFTIPREGIDHVTTRKVSKWRSAFIVGGIIAATLVVFLTIKGRNTGSDGDPGGGGGNPI